jgi:serine/threonine-protein kinase RIO1
MTSKRKKIKTKKAKQQNKTAKRHKPVLLTCLLTNKTIKIPFTKATKLQKKLSFESIDELAGNFLSKEVCNLLKQGFSEDQICIQHKQPIRKLNFRLIRRYIKTFKSEEHMFKKRKRKIVKQVVEESNENKKRVSEPLVYNPKPVDFKDAQSVADLTKDSCHRPDIYLNNDHYCNGCYIYELCACKLKRWSNKEINVKRNKKS